VVAVRQNRKIVRRRQNPPMHPMLTDRELKDMVRGIRRAAEKVRGKGLR